MPAVNPHARLGGNWRFDLGQLIEWEPTGPNEGMILPVVLRWWLGDFS
jgi:hypothetical protein